jgi:hypothetical protein
MVERYSEARLKNICGSDKVFRIRIRIRKGNSAAPVSSFSGTTPTAVTGMDWMEMKWGLIR